MYSYELSKDIKKYFKENFFIEYDVSVKEVPDSILIIPLLANILPIAWMVGFDIIIDSIDSDFYEAVLEIKEVFTKEFPEIKNKNSNIICKKFVKNISSHTRSAMLFSGGVDAYASYFNHQNEEMDLILIRGADIPVDDEKQWETAQKSVNDEVILNNNLKHFITMNCRDFYTYKVDELIVHGSWWGKVQHGLALTCAVAPLAYVSSYKLIYIAATHSSDFKMFWGSMPEIDNNIEWCSTRIVHDGYHMRRIDKVQSIVSNTEFLGKKISLRVCYSELNNGLNCNECEKCYRTIFALTLFNANPNNFGFNVSQNFYKNVEKVLEEGFSTEGIRHAWKSMIDPLNKNQIYQFEGQEYDKRKLDNKIRLALLSKVVQKKSKIYKLKRKVIATFPDAFKSYLKIRGLFK